MPLGYILAPRSKILTQAVKKKDNVIIDSSIKKMRRNEPTQIISEIIEPVQKQLVPVKGIICMILVLSPDMSKCFQVLSKLKKHPKADPFLFPVDTNIIKDYLIYVKGIIKII